MSATTLTRKRLQTDTASTLSEEESRAYGMVWRNTRLVVAAGPKTSPQDTR